MNQTPTSLDNLITQHASSRLFDGGFGLEKENLRVTADGKLTTSPHPTTLGNKLEHPYITTDFSESQLEMITPVLNSTSDALGFLETIHDEVSLQLDNEYLWPQSSPPHLPEHDEDIPIANFGSESRNGQDKEIYRHQLAKKYGRKKQMFCGVHFNVSLDKKVLDHLYQKYKPNYVSNFDGASHLSVQTPLDHLTFREQIYLKTLRNFKRYRWFLIALLGNSPAVHRSYIKCCVEQLPGLNEEAVHHTHASSMRNGVCGYRNKEYLQLDYSSVENYQSSLQALIDDQVVDSARENYASIRLKLNETSQQISHLEVRLLDLNPALKAGIDLHHLNIIHLFLIHCLIKEEDTKADDPYLRRAFENHERAATTGLNPDTMIITDDDSEIPLQAALENTFAEIESSVAVHLPVSYQRSFENLRRLIQQPDSRPAAVLRKNIQQHSYIQWTMDKACEYLQQTQTNNFAFHGFEDMELSTQLIMRHAILRGLPFEVMDRSANFLKLQYNDHKEYVRQATRTSLDNYASVLLMENKVMTKKVLSAAGIRVPEGAEYDSPNIAKSDYNLYQDQAIVIKPKSTNFGLGITILKENSSESHFLQAIDMAFQHDESILIESFILGKEYRFFLINHEVVGILQRVPANITGDGKATISELVTRKNKNPLRGKGYRTPLEKIAQGEAETLFLSTQDYNFNTVPADGKVIYLRENSNISTGGDSIDMTDDIPTSYKAIASAAANELDVNITGLDMMIQDTSEEANATNHAIIEMNFNPAIHIHCFPHRGKNRQLNGHILDALFPESLKS